MWKSIKRLLVYFNLMAEKATETDAINEAQVEAGIRAQKEKAGKANYANGQLAGQVALLKDQIRRQEQKKEELTSMLQAAANANDEANGAQYAEELANLESDMKENNNQLQVIQDTYKQNTEIIANSLREIQKLFVDFAGDTLEYVNTETGEMIKVQVFVACLPYTDYAFALCIPSQRVEDFLYAISKCMDAIGGVPKILVTDNLKSAVIKADKYEPTLNKALEDMGNHYRFVTIPCRPYSPTHKALVENQVKIIYRRVYAKLRNTTFYSLEDLNEAVCQKMLEHNQTRMQQRPYSREEQFFAVEKNALSPLPEQPYQMKFTCDLQVRNDGFVYLARDKHYYSVPFVHIGKRSHVIYTRTLVKIFVNNEVVATHERHLGFGHTHKNEHLASNSNAILSRSPEYYQEKADKHSAVFKQLVSDMFLDLEQRQIPPEFKYKTCDFMLSIGRKTPVADFEQACQIAIQNRSYSGKFLQNVISNLNVDKAQSESKERINPQPTNHENMRGNSYYK